MATNDTSQHPLGHIPLGEYQQWLNDPCTIAAKAALEEDLQFAAKQLIEYCAYNANPDLGYVKMMGAQHRSHMMLLDIMFGRSS